MTGQSLFPDDYPVPPEPDRRPQSMCCAADQAPGPHNPYLWHIVHLLGHSRIPFTAATVAAMTGVAANDATNALEHATDIEWLAVPRRESRTDPTLTWVGRLPRR